MYAHERTQALHSTRLVQEESSQRSTMHHGNDQYGQPYNYPRSSYATNQQPASDALLSPSERQQIHDAHYSASHYVAQPLTESPEAGQYSGGDPTSPLLSSQWASTSSGAPYGYHADSSVQSSLDLAYPPGSHPSVPSLPDNQPLSSDSWSPTTQDHPSINSSQQLTKPKRQKPRIALAPDQPPTTQGKPRARVYVACLQCRTRKTRCDGAKPVCHNCSRRATGEVECTYDSMPKRRGPDKTPGARQRGGRGIRDSSDPGLPRARRRLTLDVFPLEELGATESSLPPTGPLSLHTGIHDYVSPTSPPSNESRSPMDYLQTPVSASSVSDITRTQLGMSGGSSPAQMSRRYSDSPPYGLPYTHSGGTFTASDPYTTVQYQVGEDENGDENYRSPLTNQPSMSFARKTWWDSLLSLYTWSYPIPSRPLTSLEREQTSQAILVDIRFLFKTSNCWFSFFHIPSFFATYCDPFKRDDMQPSLVLAMLAVAMFWRSSERGFGESGRARAMRLRAEAQGALEASFNAGWVDETLAQAAWLLALFEVCAHPEHTRSRAVSAMVMLDNIIRSLTLTFVDADNPEAAVFLPRSVPVISSRVSGQISMLQTHYVERPTSTAEGCPCNKLALSNSWPGSKEHAPIWGPSPGWDESWTEAEIRKESCRRLCWSSMTLAAGHMSYAENNRPTGTMFFLSDPSNYALCFSGESLTRRKANSWTHSKNTIWALHERCYLLWHGCVRMRYDEAATEAEKSQFSVQAWLEADVLESSLNRHSCEYERAMVYQGREYIFHTRMCITYEFRRYIPLVPSDITNFYRQKAEEWLTHQGNIAKRMIQGLHMVTGNTNNTLTLRPFFVFWLMGQVMNSMRLYQRDKTLTIALDLCTSILPCIEFLSSLWPCPEQRRKYGILRGVVEQERRAAGLPFLPPTGGLYLAPTSAV